jgi:hypothetical protein
LEIASSGDLRVFITTSQLFCLTTHPCLGCQERPDLGKLALLLRGRRRCLGLDILYASTSPETIELRAAVVALQGIEANKFAVFDGFVTVGVLTATSGARWFWCGDYCCSHIGPFISEARGTKRGLVTRWRTWVPLRSCLLVSNTAYAARHPNLSAQYFARKVGSSGDYLILNCSRPHGEQWGKCFRLTSSLIG